MIPNLAIPVNQWVNIYQETGIEVGTKIMVFNVGDFDVRLTTALHEPPLDHDDFVILEKGGFPLANDQGDVGAWAFAQSYSKVKVRVIS